MNINDIINKIKSFKKFEINEYCSVVNEYGEDLVLYAFKIMLKNCNKNNIKSMIKKYSFVFITLEVQKKNLSEEDLDKLAKNYGEDAFYNYLNMVTSSDIGKSILKENYDVVYKYLFPSEEELNNNENSNNDEAIYVDDNAFSAYLRDSCQYEIFNPEEEREAFKTLKESSDKIKIATLDGLVVNFNDLYLLLASIKNKDQFKFLYKVTDYVDMDSKKIINEYRKLCKKNSNSNDNLRFLDRNQIEKIFNVNLDEKECYNSAFLDEQFKCIFTAIECKDEINRRNQKLVVSIVKKFHPTGCSYMDLAMEGNIGLMKSIDKFDYTRDVKFSTYATWWIRQYIGRYIADNNSTIRIPVHASEKIFKYKNALKFVSNRLEKNPTNEDMADALGWDVTQVIEVQRCINISNSLSIDAPIDSNDEDTSLDFFIKDTTEDTPYVSIAKKNTSDIVKNALSYLTDKEEFVLCLRNCIIDKNNTRFMNLLKECVNSKLYDCDENTKEKIKDIISKIYIEPATLEEIGFLLGVTRERIRQIESKSKKKLKIKLKNLGIRDLSGFSD